MRRCVSPWGVGVWKLPSTASRRMSSPVRRLPGHSWPHRPLVSGDERGIWNAFHRTRGSWIGIVVSSGLASWAIIRCARSRTASSVPTDSTQRATASWAVPSSAVSSLTGCKRCPQCQIYVGAARPAETAAGIRDGDWCLCQSRIHWRVSFFGTCLHRCSVKILAISKAGCTVRCPVPKRVPRRNSGVTARVGAPPVDARLRVCHLCR